MSLKSFHILLISLSSLLTLVFSGWSFRAWRETETMGWLALSFVSLAVALSLAVYVVWFARSLRTRDEEDRRRRRMIRPLAALVTIGTAAATPLPACSVCYGEAEGPLIDAARLGVFLLFGLVLAVQCGFVLFFLRLRRRARDVAQEPLSGWAE